MAKAASIVYSVSLTSVIGPGKGTFKLGHSQFSTAFFRLKLAGLTVSLLDNHGLIRM